MNLTLKTCPFCGHEAIAQKWGTGKNHVYITCSNTEFTYSRGGCSGAPHSHGKTAKAAAKQWNDRYETKTVVKVID